MNKNKILVVDDNSDCRELFALVLRRSGYVVVEAATGLDALDQTHATHPDLILMDLCLPKMSGDAATAQLKADPSTRDIPVIVCTALHRGALTERASAAGGGDFTQTYLLQSYSGRGAQIFTTRRIRLLRFLFQPCDNATLNSHAHKGADPSARVVAYGLSVSRLRLSS